MLLLALVNPWGLLRNASRPHQLLPHLPQPIIDIIVQYLTTTKTHLLGKPSIFYTKESISPTFHDGSAIETVNIKKDWSMMVTKNRNGKYYTLNNRMLFAHKKTLWADPNGDAHYLMCIEFDVKEIPFEVAVAIFGLRFNTITNGNECRITGEHGKQDWVCGPCVNQGEYNRFVVSRQRDPWTVQLMSSLICVLQLAGALIGFSILLPLFIILLWAVGALKDLLVAHISVFVNVLIGKLLVYAGLEGIYDQHA